MNRSINHKGILCIAILFLCAIAVKSDAQVKWLTWHEAIEKSKKVKKKIIVNVYINGVEWNRLMDQNNYSNPFIASKINENFYAIKFNAAQKYEIVIKDKVYKYSSTKGCHELAEEIMKGGRNFPTTVFLDEDFVVLQAIPGYIEPVKFEKIINYFGLDYYKTMPWCKFDKKCLPDDNGAQIRQVGGN